MTAPAKSRRPTFRLTDLERAIKGVQAAGLTVKSVEITVDGAVRVLTHTNGHGVPINENDDWVTHSGSAQDA